MKKENYISVNPKVLIWARKALVLNKKNAADRLSISINKLNLLENGDKSPTLEELKNFAKIYKRTIATLLLNNPPQENPPPKDHRTINSEKLGSIGEKTILAIRKARALAFSLIELKKDFDIVIPNLSYRASLNAPPEDLAHKLRKELELDSVRQYLKINDILEAYIEKIESLGIAVFQLSLTEDNIRGFSITDDVIPIIGIKRGQEQPTAKIFTLFHELGHILLNEGGICDLSIYNKKQIEIWCNAFAGEILIPSYELVNMERTIKQKSFNNKIWLRKDLVELGNYFHVGPLAILRSLLKNNLTTSQFYKEKHEKWNKPTFGRSKNPEGRNLPKESIKERGRTFVSLAFTAYDHNKINLKDLSDYLGVKLSYIPKTRQLLNA